MSKVQFSKFLLEKKRNKPSWTLFIEFQPFGKFFSDGGQNCILGVQENFMGVFFFEKWYFSGNLLHFPVLSHWAKNLSPLAELFGKLSKLKFLCREDYFLEYLLSSGKKLLKSKLSVHSLELLDLLTKPPSTEERTYWGKMVFFSKKWTFHHLWTMIEKLWALWDGTMILVVTS